MLIRRDIEKLIISSLSKGKIIIIYGPRQAGKTTLVKMIIKEHPKDSLYLNCDEIDVRQNLTGKTSTELRAYLSGKKLVVIDEAQRVENIGLTLKLIADNIPVLQVIATGSSSFELSDRIKEPLTGRKIEFHLYPFSVHELSRLYAPNEITRLLERRIIYGMYPEVVIKEDPNVLAQLADSYLYKDVLAYQNIKKHDVLLHLLQALALQVGNEVSYNELSVSVGIDKKTVESYLNILEQAFVIFRLMPFSRNLRNELKKLRKIYFYDTGVRNALVNNLNMLNIRNDAGALFENFMISERIKRNSNLGIRKNVYFWRTHQQKEIDYIEESGGKLEGFEFKLNPRRYDIPKDFIDAYPGSTVELLTRENFQKFLMP
ncbi:MAG: ATP-binding protein [Candidatus Tantalella remota]|nr:ATP-binding protein [Candidatus Tantalella remota]